MDSHSSREEPKSHTSCLNMRVDKYSNMALVTDCASVNTSDMESHGFSQHQEEDYSVVLSNIIKHSEAMTASTPKPALPPKKIKPAVAPMIQVTIQPRAVSPLTPQLPRKLLSLTLKGKDNTDCVARNPEILINHVSDSVTVSSGQDISVTTLVPRAPHNVSSNGSDKPYQGVTLSPSSSLFGGSETYCASSPNLYLAESDSQEVTVLRRHKKTDKIRLSQCNRTTCIIVSIC